MIDGDDALEWRPKGARPSKPPPRVYYNNAFREIEAYTAMGLSASEYDKLPGTPEWIDEESGGLSKSHVVAWHAYHRILQNLDRGMF